MALGGIRPDDDVVVVDDHGVGDGDSAARRQLERLRRLVDELADVEPQAALPLIVSAASVALDLDQLCVHMLEPGGVTLRRVAAIGVAEPFLSAMEVVPLGAAGGPIGLVAESGAIVVVDDVAAGPPPSGPLWGDRREAAAAAGIRSSWAVPIVRDGQLLGVASGYAPTIGRPPAELLEVGMLYAGYAAGAIEAQALRRSQALHRDFLSRVSHELRTPLTAIHGHASSLLQPDVAWDETSRGRFLRAIASESERMSRLVGDLLDFSAIESGVLPLHFDWCRLPLVLQAALDCLPPERADEIDLSCDEGLEPVWADHDRLEQVIVNLVENALHHTPTGTRVRVGAGWGRRPGTVAIRVADDGPGIPPGDADRLFQPYVRGATKGPGAGLGLSIVAGIVKAHGGTIRLEPVEQGATFVVELPSDRNGGERAGDG